MRIGVLTDVHIAPAGAEPISWHSPLLLETAGDRYSAALGALASHGVEAVVVLGDLTHDGDDASADELIERSAASGLRMLWVLGNHDVVPSVTAVPDALARSGVQAIAIAGSAAADIAGMPVHGIGVRPDVGIEQYRADVVPVPGAPAVVLSHFPVLSRAGRFAETGLRYAGDLTNREDVAVAVAEHPTLVLSGHLHARTASAQGHTLQLSFGALVEEPFDAAVLEVDPDVSEVAVEFVLGRGPWPVVDLPDRVRFLRRGAAWVRDR